MQLRIDEKEVETILQIRKFQKNSEIGSSTLGYSKDVGVFGTL